VIRTDPNIPALQPVTLVTKTALSVKAIPVRYVRLPVYTEMSVEQTAVAIRADTVEIFTALGFGLNVF